MRCSHGHPPLRRLQPGDKSLRCHPIEGQTGHKGGWVMRSPVSTCLLLGFDVALERAVFDGVVGDAVLPAAPDDVEPGSGEDADGVGVVVASVAGALVE